jgi:lipopolysaccharide/colanic/teichoic acid biosynthesis glycosyltransferase
MTGTRRARARDRPNGVGLAAKTLLDIAIALPSLVIVGPLMGLLALVIKLDSPGPAIYRRRVLGRGGKPFYAYKLRTMHVEGDDLLSPEQRRRLSDHHKLKDDPRVTRVGRWLRRYSLDELPQLINVVLGHMSLVGPRIITTAERTRYGPEVPMLLAVKPGLTGPWQIAGRSDLHPDERVRMDLEYAREFSLLRDIAILIRTPLAVLSGRGAY